MSVLDVRGRRVAIVLGAGGVGKTTVAAAIALHAAISGRRALVLTIDPARRLAAALGVAPLAGVAREVDLGPLRAGGLPARGRLFAMVLDRRSALDELVARHAPADLRRRLLANPFYVRLTRSFAGSQEYAALEEVCALAGDPAWDLVVVDTPPARHALDFLDAPRRLADFFDASILRWFAIPLGAAVRSAARAGGIVARFVAGRLEGATGAAALREISDMFSGLAGVAGGLHDRIARAAEVLRAPATAFVLVTTPDAPQLADAAVLAAAARRRGLHLEALVVNRLHAPAWPLAEPLPGPDEVASALLRALGPDGLDARHLAAGFLDSEALARREAAAVVDFAAGPAAGLPISEVPRLAADVHDLAGLARLFPYLFGEPDGSGS